MLYRRVMSARARISAVVLVTVTALALGGCVPSEPDPTSSPEPTATPVFASEEEALAAATDAYAAYLKASDTILSEGGINPERIDEVAVGEAADSAREASYAFSNKGFRSTGETTFGNLRVQRYSPRASGSDEILSAYLCEDVSDVDVLDAVGISVVSIDRPPKQAYEVAFQRADDSMRLVLSRATTWEGTGVCE